MNTFSNSQGWSDHIGDELVSTRQVITLLNISRSTFYRWKVHPDFPEPQILSSRTVRYWRSDVFAFIASQPGRSDG
jgi:predicted DNA-binding transcriptional regulator AlpA